MRTSLEIRQLEAFVATARTLNMAQTAVELRLTSYGESRSLKALETELQALTTVEGKPYRLLKLPMPDEMVFDGERLPATYANFLVINGAVIVPVYGQREKDEQAKALVAEAFPGREIVAVDASVIVRQHGSIHCLTMQLPKGLIKNNF